MCVCCEVVDPGVICGNCECVCGEEEGRGM